MQNLATLKNSGKLRQMEYLVIYITFSVLYILLLFYISCIILVKYKNSDTFFQAYMTKSPKVYFNDLGIYILNVKSNRSSYKPAIMPLASSSIAFLAASSTFGTAKKFLCWRTSMPTNLNCPPMSRVSIASNTPAAFH